jgi:putative ABC transport system permease protein
MFTLTYLRRELRRRLRQTTVVSSGLAVAIGLVITVTALSAGVQDAQERVLQSLYGVGTDVSVTQQPKAGETSLAAFAPIAEAIQSGGLTTGKTISADGLIGYGSQNAMGGTGLGRLEGSSIADIAKLPGVSAAAGGLTATNLRLSARLPTGELPGDGWVDVGGMLVHPEAFQVNGVDLATAGRFGPLASGAVTAGRAFTTADSTASVAIVDSGYAADNRLATGSSMTVAGTTFTVIGIVTQPPGSAPADVYIPLPRAQSLAQMPDQVNTIYVAAGRAADVAAVRDRISRLLPAATVTTSTSLADEVSGSLATTARLAEDVGRWLAIAVLLAAFALACLLTLSAVSRRSAELGLLRALGWHSRRVVGQVTSEALAQGAVGAVLGIALGVGVALLISALAPPLSASVALPGTSSVALPGSIGGPLQSAIASSRKVSTLELSAQITPNMIVLAVLLALAGGLVAGALGSWRAARLRPAIALRRVE